MNLRLEDLGWDAWFAGHFARYGAEGLAPARVALEHTHLYRVYTDGGEVLANVSGGLRHRAKSRADYPAVGDWVAVQPVWHGGRARIQAVLPRKSKFSRKVAGEETEEQVVAANVDTIFLAMGLDGDYNLRRIERYLVTASDSGAHPVVVLTKADLAADLDTRVAEVQRLAGLAPVIPISAKTGQGLSTLDSYLQKGQTVAVLGSSGVGKSTLINRLIGKELLKTRDVREHDSRGRHTTKARQLVVLPSGALVIDTPGMRELQLWDPGEGFSRAFDDIEAFAAGCHFRDCRHHEEPRCAVKAAVAEGRLSAERLESYLKLRREADALAERQEKFKQLDAKRRAKIGSKALDKRLEEKDRT